MTTLFIKRPVLTLTLNAFVILLGFIGYQSLNLSEYPEISVPKIKIGIVYPGASMQVIENDIAFYLEEELSGIPKVNNIRSEIGNGYCETWISFKPGASIEQAMIDVRDRVARVKPRWPKEVEPPYVEQEGKDQNITAFVTLSSQTRKADELTHLAKLYVKNQLQSIQGTSSVTLWGVPYVMEIQLDRLKMAGHQIKIEQVLSALRNNQVSLAAGKFQGEIPITLRLELEHPQDFESIVIQKAEDSVVLLKDIAQVKLSHDRRVLNRINNRDAVFLALNKASDGNPLTISKQIQALLPKLRASLPADVKIQMDYDGARFVKSSLASLGWTILEACALVLLVVFFFLKNLKATLIPLVAIPISLIGALAIAKLCGFSLNTFSLLALVLAVGLVVDDAIVIVENIYRHLEKGLSAKEAAMKGSQEIAFAVIAMTLTLSAVFMPVALTGGLVGQVLVEFGVTLAAAVLVSGFVALTLSPWMCSRLLDRADTHASSGMHIRELRFKKSWTLGTMAAILIATGLIYQHLPKRIVPIEDRGFMGVFIEPLPGMTLEKMLPYIDQVQSLVGKNPNIENRFLFSNPVWKTGMTMALKDYSQRTQSSSEMVSEFREKLHQVPSITSFVWNWDTGLPGFEPDADGADISLMIQTTHSYQELSNQLDALKKAFKNNSILQDISSDLEFNFPGLKADIDTSKMALLEISVKDAATTLRALFDQNEDLEFFKDGLRYKVLIKGAEFPDNLHELHVLNDKGALIPLSTFMTLKPVAEPKYLTHYNRLRGAMLKAQLKPGATLSNGIDEFKTSLRKLLPSGYSYSFVGAAQNWLDSSDTFIWLLALALLFIYGVLAIQFESFLDPLLILVTVPLAAFGALLAVWISGQEFNIFGQIGLVTLIGLISKHGILLVDFANKTGSMKQAISLRLRPILMTTGAMVLGALPLMFASGAGAEARRSIGLVLVSGLLFGTLLTLYALPLVYRLFKHRMA